MFACQQEQNDDLLANKMIMIVGGHHDLDFGNAYIQT